MVLPAWLGLGEGLKQLYGQVPSLYHCHPILPLHEPSWEALRLIQPHDDLFELLASPPGAEGRNAADVPGVALLPEHH